MKNRLDYFTLLSPAPLTIPGVGSIVSPTLRSISMLGNGFDAYNIYQNYISTLLTDVHSYIHAISNKSDTYFKKYSSGEMQAIYNAMNQYMDMSASEQSKISIFNFLAFDRHLLEAVLNALNFFMLEKVEFSPNTMLLVTYDRNASHDAPCGYINSSSYPYITDIILQRINIVRTESEEKNVKLKNQTAARLLEKMKNTNRHSPDKKLELPNIISALASHHNSLNMANIWDLTVYQLYDQFLRQRVDDAYNIQAMSISAWGDSKGHFNDTMWFTPPHEN